MKFQRRKSRGRENRMRMSIDRRSRKQKRRGSSSIQEWRRRSRGWYHALSSPTSTSFVPETLTPPLSNYLSFSSLTFTRFGFVINKKTVTTNFNNISLYPNAKQPFSSETILRCYTIEWVWTIEKELVRFAKKKV